MFVNSVVGFNAEELFLLLKTYPSRGSLVFATYCQRLRTRYLGTVVLGVSRCLLTRRSRVQTPARPFFFCQKTNFKFIYKTSGQPWIKRSEKMEKMGVRTRIWGSTDIYEQPFVYWVTAIIHGWTFISVDGKKLKTYGKEDLVRLEID